MRSIGLSLSLVVTIAVASPALADAPFTETMRTIQFFGHEGLGNRDSVWSPAPPTADFSLPPGSGEPEDSSEPEGGDFEGMFGSHPALGGPSDHWPSSPSGGQGGSGGGGASGNGADDGPSGEGGGWNPAQDGLPTRGTPLPAPGAALLGMIGFGFIGRLRRRTAR